MPKVPSRSLHLVACTCFFAWMSSLLAAKATAEAPQASASKRTEEPGDNAHALPGFVRLAAATTGGRRMGFALSGGYGWTEAQNVVNGPQDAAHHRLFGSATISGRPLRWLSLYLNAEGYYDIHPKDQQGTDTSIVGQPRLGVRFGLPIKEEWHVGAEISTFVPGASAPSLDFSATSVDSFLLANYQPRGVTGLTLGIGAGYRFDQSAKAADDDTSTLRQGDFISLGLSDYDAFLARLAASYRRGRWEWLAEYSWDLWLGSGAPDLSKTPMHLSGGGRYFIAPSMQVEMIVDGLLTARPPVTIGGDLFRIEPRVSVMLGFRYALPFDKPANSQAAAIAATSATAATAAAMPVGAVAGRVLDERGQAIEGATIELRAADGKALAQTSDAQGNYRFASLSPGEATLTATAPNFQARQQTAVITAKRVLALEQRLQPVRPPAQLRGLIRSFNGRGIRATVRIEPGGTEANTGDDGRFSLDIAPGSYAVEISAADYLQQTRNVVIEEQGVTVLNVELRQGKGNRAKRSKKP